jgi:asparagine synthetase B (glutamine-hydrolysing)
LPFLDHTLVEFAAAMPDRLKIHGTTQKYILKKAVKDLPPRSVIHRHKWASQLRSAIGSARRPARPYSERSNRAMASSRLTSIANK